MEYISTQEAAEKWKVSVRYVQKLLSESRIEGARRYGRNWMIPCEAEKPGDPRITDKKEMTTMKHLLPRKTPGLIMTTIYSQPGSADEVLEGLRKNPDAYRLFQAELLYLRCEYLESREIMQSLAVETECFDTGLGSRMGIMHTCLYIGDYPVWDKARKEISNMPYKNEQEKAVIEMCAAATDSALYDKRSYPEWLKEGKLDLLPMDCFPAARYYFIKYLTIEHVKFDQKQIVNLLCSQTRAEGAVAAELYQRLFAAAAFHMHNRKEDCLINLNRALELALPDRLYAPLAESRKEIGYLIDKMLREYDMTAYKAVDRLWKQLVPSWTNLYQKRFKRPMTNHLTLREDEVMKYAAMDMTNDEIAEAIGLGVGTVKNYISSILNKTGLHDRRQFARYITLS